MQTRKPYFTRGVKRIYYVMFIIIVMFSLVHHVQGETWPQYRYDNHNGGYSESNISDYYEVSWVRKLDDYIQSTPVVDEEHVYVYPTEIKTLYALDRHTGEEVWHFRSERDDAPSSGWKPTGATISGSNVFIGMSDGYLYCLDRSSGNMVWEFDTDYTISSSPIIQDGAVFFGTNGGEFYSLDKADGELNWVYDDCGSVHSTAAISDGVVFFGSLDGNVYAVDQRGNVDDPNPLYRHTTDLIWQYETEGEIYSSPAISGNMLFIGSNDKHLYAIDKDSGEEIWTFETGRRVFTSVALKNNRIVVATYFDTYALCQETGEIIWEYSPKKELHGSPAIIANRVVFGDGRSNLYILDFDTGEEVFARFLPDNYTEDYAITSTPGVAGGDIFVTNNGNYTFCLSPAVPPEDDWGHDSYSMTSETACFSILAAALLISQLKRGPGKGVLRR